MKSIIFIILSLASINLLASSSFKQSEVHLMNCGDLKLKATGKDWPGGANYTLKCSVQSDESETTLNTCDLIAYAKIPNPPPFILNLKLQDQSSVSADLVDEKNLIFVKIDKTDMSATISMKNNMNTEDLICN